jgi:hypothetical protein
VNEDKAAKYHRLKRRTSIASLLLSVVMLCGLVVTGWTLSLRNTAEAAFPFAPVVAYVFLLSLINELVAIPIAFQ